jgi:hypothetical protein
MVVVMLRMMTVVLKKKCLNQTKLLYVLEGIYAMTLHPFSVCFFL